MGEKMVDVKCSVCNSDMQMPASFVETGEKRGIDTMLIPHICSNCVDKMGDFLGDGKMKGFVEDVNKQMEKMGKNNEIAEDLAEKITSWNIDSLMKELRGTGVSEEDKIKEAFYRGVWMTLFLIGNNHESDFLEKEIKSIEEFHEKMKEREEMEDEGGEGDWNGEDE